ncbi:MAG: AmmeMemoRadiSam system protein B [Thermodesulfobacteriota bacterium]|nr:AmmeMemoRadiSam system protein B [Thermodesulfobacteriota bacterium]
MDIRQPVYAGSWYPGNAADCERQINRFLEQAPAQASGQTATGVIVPHAGWAFSGGIACRALSLLNTDPAPETVIIFGMHLPSGAAPVIMPDGGIDTPFGPLMVDTRLAETLTSQFSFERETAVRFSPDNTIELQLPFIKYLFKNARILPIGVPPTPMAMEIGRFTAESIKDRGIQASVVGSTDLTHYGPSFGMTHYGLGDAAHDNVRNNEDSRIIDRMVAMDPEGVLKEARTAHNACCAGAAAASIALARGLGASNARLTEYATSYDKNPGDTFVGYAGIVMAGSQKVQ